MCFNCDTQFSHPLAPDSDIYNFIYENADRIRAYSRYSDFSRLVLGKEDPLGFLAAAEDVYWFVADYLAKSGIGRQADILEVGSGLGYLTYAIRKRGYERIRGMDISARAVRRATGLYGNLYFSGDLLNYSRDTSDRYDLIIMTEVIEHVADVFSLLEAAKALLKPDGTLIVTTPNKSRKSPRAYWETDNPPVHLWWFSEASMRQIAIRIGMNVQFWDFSRYHADRVVGIGPLAGWSLEPALPPYIDADGSILQEPRREGKTVRTIKHMLGLAIGDLVFDKLKTALHSPGRTALFVKNSVRAFSARSATTGIVLRLDPPMRPPSTIAAR
jgi:SAM-dependent methyltransferase